MIIEMSKNSKIYHRTGCTYIDRIQNDALTKENKETKEILSSGSRSRKKEACGKSLGFICTT